MTEPERRTLAVAAAATLIALVAFTTAPATMGLTVESLGGGTAGLTWGLSGMSVGLAAALLPLGALADDLGRRRVLVWSTAALAVTSALIAAAPSIGLFVAARVAQGVAAGGVIAASLGIIGHTFPSGQARTAATGVWSAALGGGIALGPLAAAALTGVGEWRGGYWLQAVVAASLVPAAARLTESRGSTRRPVAIDEALLLAAATTALTAGLVEGRSDWASASTLVLLGAGVLLLAGFAAVELRRRAPMLDLRLVREPLFVASLAGALFTGLAVISLMSYLITFLRQGLGTGLAVCAVVLAAWSGTSVVAALGSRRLPATLSSPSRLAIGLGLAAVGLLALTGVHDDSTSLRLVPGLLIAGVGSGLANAALGRLAVESVPPDQAGMGSGANNTARYLGSAAGVALVVAVSGAAGSGSGPAALVDGWNAAAVVCAVLSLVGALIAVACRPPGTQVP